MHILELEKNDKKRKNLEAMYINYFGSTAVNFKSDTLDLNDITIKGVIQKYETKKIRHSMTLDSGFFV